MTFKEPDFPEGKKCNRCVETREGYFSLNNKFKWKLTCDTCLGKRKDQYDKTMSRVGRSKRVSHKKSKIEKELKISYSKACDMGMGADPKYLLLLRKPMKDLCDGS